MEDQDLNTSIYKILNLTLPNKFPFIDGVKDVILTGSHVGHLKLKIILNKEWVEKNFFKEAIKYINDDIENDGYSLLAPFTVESYSKGLINYKEIDSFVATMVKFLGVSTDINSRATSYIIE